MTGSVARSIQLQLLGPLKRLSLRGLERPPKLRHKRLDLTFRLKWLLILLLVNFLYMRELTRSHRGSYSFPGAEIHRLAL